MSDQSDYSVLDSPLILQFVFHPRGDWTPPPSGAKDYLVPVEAKVSISCRFYPVAKGSACILFFHGNGEVACDYDWIAPVYNQIGISLFVADYRGYGLSGGTPAFSTMVGDAHPIFDFFLDTVGAVEYGQLYVMGKSLGSHSALEIAYHEPERLAGLIIESGSATVTRLLSLLSLPLESNRTKELDKTILARVSCITLPVLIIHGEQDNLIPASEAVKLFDTVGSKVKRLVTIPGVGHNDIMLAGMDKYFSAIKEFVFP